jgi:hypothetical protein
LAWPKASPISRKRTGVKGGGSVSSGSSGIPEPVRDCSGIETALTFLFEYL